MGPSAESVFASWPELWDVFRPPALLGVQRYDPKSAGSNTNHPTNQPAAHREVQLKGTGQRQRKAVVERNRSELRRREGKRAREKERERERERESERERRERKIGRDLEGGREEEKRGGSEGYEGRGKEEKKDHPACSGGCNI